MSYWKNKVVVVTGAGSGIGQALALEWAKQGARLAICDNNPTTLEQTIKRMATPQQPFAQVVDVAKEEAVYAFAEAVIAHYGQVDAVVNNAGVVQTSTDVIDYDLDDFRWLMDINFWGMVYGCHAFLPHLRQRPQSHLANVSSIFGMIGTPGLSSYHASKFAIRGFTESLVLEERLAKSGVAVSSIHPGGIKTNIMRSARGIEQGKDDLEAIEALFKTRPEQAAKVIIKGMRQRKDRILVGSDAHLINWSSKWLRKVVQWASLSNVRKTRQGF